MDLASLDREALSQILQTAQVASVDPDIELFMKGEKIRWMK